MDSNLEVGGLEMNLLRKINIINNHKLNYICAEDLANHNQKKIDKIEKELKKAISRFQEKYKEEIQIQWSDSLPSKKVLEIFYDTFGKIKK